MRGRVRFSAGGAAYELRFTTNALCRLEEVAGKGVMVLADELAQGSFTLGRIRLMFWAGLDGAVTEDQAGDLIDAIGFERAAELISEAFEQAFPSGEADEGKREGVAAA